MGSIALFERYLNDYQISKVEILDHLDAVDPDASVIVTGSVPQGRGNRLSDIDLMIIGPNVEQRLRSEFHFDHAVVIERVARLSNGHEINLFTITRDGIDEMARRLRICGALLRDPAAEIGGIPLLSRPSYRLLDDIATGAVLRGEDVVTAFKDQLLLDDVPAHILLLAVTDHLVLREDAIGQMERGSCETALMLLREAAVSLSEAVLASAGIANTRLQWRFALLAEAAPIVGDETVERLKRYLLRPESDPARIRSAQTEFANFADQELMRILGRVAHLGPAFMKLSQHQQFQTTMASA